MEKNESFLDISREWSKDEPRRPMGVSDAKIAMEVVRERVCSLPTHAMFLIPKIALLALNLVAHGNRGNENHQAGVSRPKRSAAPQWNKI